MLSVSNAIQDLSPNKIFMQRIRRSGNNKRSIELTEKVLQEQGYRTIIPIIQSAVARIRATDKAGKVLRNPRRKNISGGSGIGVGLSTLFTAGHVTSYLKELGAKQIFADFPISSQGLLPGNDLYKKFILRAEQTATNEKDNKIDVYSIPVRVSINSTPCHHKVIDFDVLEIDTQESIEIPFLTVSDEYPRYGETILACGHKGATKHNHLSSGRVNSNLTDEGEGYTLYSWDKNPRENYYIGKKSLSSTALVGKGMSGGLFCGLHGLVYGVLSHEIGMVGGSLACPIVKSSC